MVLCAKVIISQTISLCKIGADLRVIGNATGSYKDYGGSKFSRGEFEEDEQ